MKKYIFFLAAFGSSLFSHAQTENAAFTLTGMGVTTPFARDYQALGINPANLDIASPYVGKRRTLGFGEFGVSLYSDILSRTDLRNNITGANGEEFTQEEQIQYAIDFANSRNTADIDVMSLGFHLQTNRLGSFAFSTRERFDYFSVLGDQMSELLWLGYTSPYFEQLVLNNGDTIQNTGQLDQATIDMIVEGITTLQNAQTLSDFLEGTQFRFSWVREINFGYGKKLLSTDSWELHGGIGVKYLWGQGMLDINADNGKATAFAALAPVFNIDYGSVSNANPSALGNDAGKFSPVGQGWGFDLGAHFILKNKLFISAAVNDIGSIKWDGNLYELNDVAVTSFGNAGLESVDFYEQFQNLTGNDGLVTWQGSQSRVTKLPTTGRLGVGIQLTSKLKAGVDFVAPFNEEVGSLDKPVISMGGEFSPVRWLHLSAGFIQGGNYDFKIPAGITFTAGRGGYECGIASRDLITFFTENQPTVSLCMGFARFRF